MRFHELDANSNAATAQCCIAAPLTRKCSSGGLGCYYYPLNVQPTKLDNMAEKNPNRARIVATD